MLSLIIVVSLAAFEPDGGVDAAPTLPAADAPVLVPLPAPPAVSAEAEKPDPSPAFVKGELSVYLGSDRLVVKNTRVGVSLGVDQFGSAYYGLVEPLLDLRFLDGRLGIGLIAPLRLVIFDFATDPNTGTRVGFSHAGQLRKEDWDSVHDFGRVLNYVTYGRKEDTLFISAGQRYSSSIGHGSITRRYAPNLDIDYPRASAQVDMYNDYAGFEFMTNDLLEWNLLSAIAFVKPLSFFKPQALALRTLSIGVSGGVDLSAPWELTTDATGTRQLDANGRFRSTNRAAKLIGFDVELKVVKTANVDLKPYVDYSMLLGGDGGLTVGLLGRFNVGTTTVHAFRVVLEGRYLGSHYQPSFFDTFYEIDRFAYLSKDFRGPTDLTAQYVPKQRYLMETGLGTRGGYYVEASWGVPGAVGLTFAVEGVTNSPATNFVAHLEVPVLSFVQIFGSYYLRGVESFAELGNGGLFKDKAVAFAGARLKLLPFLFINARAYKTFRMNPLLQRYDNQFGLVVDLEIGYEFQKKEPAPPPKEGGATPATAMLGARDHDV
jgi:hypothetical protein